MSAALRNRVDELATEIRRLRRSAERLANHVEAIAIMLEPTAAQIAAETAPGDPIAIDEAIWLVDERQRRFRDELGGAA